MESETWPAGSPFSNEPSNGIARGEFAISDDRRTVDIGIVTPVPVVRPDILLRVWWPGHRGKDSIGNHAWLVSLNASLWGRGIPTAPSWS
jgi:hypothetical protein